MPLEKRKSPRYEVQIPLSFSGTETGGGGMVTRLSKEGYTVVSDESVRRNTFMALHLQLPKQSSPLRIEVAEVRWVGTAGFGMEFRHLRAEEQERLGRFINWLQATQNN